MNKKKCGKRKCPRHDSEDKKAKACPEKRTGFLLLLCKLQKGGFIVSMGIGYMPMPEGFQYAELAKAGRPQHQKFDEFWCKHPPMDPGKRAKIFAPFAALKGYHEQIASSQRKVSIEQENEIEYIPVYE